MLCRDSAPLELGSGRYTVESLLHESPQAALYRARDRESGAAVALKCFEPGARRAYLREASAALGLKHPHIVRCLDTFHLPLGGACVVYEFMAGGTLAERLETLGPLAPAEVRRCLGELAEGLAFLHRTGRIHCDIKPENVFVCPSGDNHLPRYVLGDLGATCFIREAKEGRHTAGSPAYIAPERVYDRFLFNSDLYSLGVVGFEIATGERPYSGAAEAVIRAHLSEPPPLHRVADPDLRLLLEHLLEKDPAQRIQHAETLLAMLERPGPAARRVEASAGPAPGLERSKPGAGPPTVPGEWGLHGVYELDPTPARPPRIAAVLAEIEQPSLAMDHGSSGEILRPGSNSPGRLFAKVGRIGSVGEHSISYGSSSRVFQLDCTHASPACLWEGCRGLIGHSYAHGHLFWQSQHSLHYVDIANDRTYAFRGRCYLSPVQVAIFPDGSFCHSDGPANEQLVFRSPVAELQARATLSGPILGLTDDAGQILAVVADMHRRGRMLAVCSRHSPVPVRTLLLPSDISDWCFAAGRVFWISGNGQVHTADTTLKPALLPPALAGAALIRVSVDRRWLALMGQAESTRKLALWKIPTPQEECPE